MNIVTQRMAVRTSIMANEGETTKVQVVPQILSSLRLDLTFNDELSNKVDTTYNAPNLTPQETSSFTRTMSILAPSYLGFTVNRKKSGSMAIISYDLSANRRKRELRFYARTLRGMVGYGLTTRRALSHTARVAPSNLELFDVLNNGLVKSKFEKKYRTDIFRTDMSWKENDTIKLTFDPEDGHCQLWKNNEENEFFNFYLPSDKSYYPYVIFSNQALSFPDEANDDEIEIQILN